MEIEDNSPKVPLNTFIPYNLKMEAQKKNIEFSKALIFGIKFQLAVLDDIDYPENPLLEKIEKLRNRLEATSLELEAFKNKEADTLFNEVKKNGESSG